LLVAERMIGSAETGTGHDQAGLVFLRYTAADALSNLVAVLELAADGQLRCRTRSRQPLAATLRLVEDCLVAGDFYDGGEPIAAFAWPMLLQTGGLARLAGPRLELTARGEAALAAPSYLTLDAIWHRWLRSVSCDEFGRVEAIKGQRRPGTLTPVAERRGAVVAGLAELEPGAWTDTGDVLDLLRSPEQPPLVVARSLLAQWHLHLDDPYHGSLGRAGSAAWDVLEGRYALCVLFEYAATLGMIDVAYADPAGVRDDYRGLWGADRHPWLSRYDGLLAIRVSELGAAVLHDPDALDGLSLPTPRLRLVR
jgi:hypothetical protein